MDFNCRGTDRSQAETATCCVLPGNPTRDTSNSSDSRLAAVAGQRLEVVGFPVGGLSDNPFMRDAANDIDSINRLTGSGQTRVTEIPDSHSDLHEKKSFANLSSLGPDGEPQLHPVWYHVVGGQLLISTGTDRQKYRNIQQDPRVSVSILDPDDPYRYLEVRGHVVEIEPDPHKAFLDLLARKYLDQETYPYEERRGVERVILHIQPDHVVAG